MQVELREETGFVATKEGIVYVRKEISDVKMELKQNIYALKDEIKRQFLYYRCFYHNV